AEFRHFELEGKPIEYWNDGDWVEGCNALVEHFDGRMEILNWPEVVAARRGADLHSDTDSAVKESELEAA
ncbi:MAG: UDP-2,3-diacylglucosamine diphosphatase, partial [Pseudomonadota bacterium]